MPASDVLRGVRAGADRQAAVRPRWVRAALGSGERKLPEEARDQLRAVLDSYDRMKANRGIASAGADAEVAKLRDMLEQNPDALWWSDIAQAELCVVEILTPEQLRARIGGWRRRMAEVIGDARYAQYIVSAPVAASAPIEELKADLAECIRAVYYFYGAYGIAAKSRSMVARSMLLVAAVVLAIGAGLAILFAVHPWVGKPWTMTCPVMDDKNALLGDPCTLYVILEYMLATAAAAVLGSVISVQRRLQDPTLDVDPFYRYIQTKADRFGIAVVSPVFGAIFGLVVYGLLAAKLLSTTIVTFDKAVPNGPSDLAAVLVLGFISGFAEQLVPDALTRIAARALGGVSGAATAPTVPSPVDRAQNGQAGAGGTSRTQAPSSNGAVTQAATTLFPRTPLVVTRGAALLGHDPNIASETAPINQQKGVVDDGNR